ncbi:MAG: L-seryl-tRNA(Sec) selenium transferase [Bryobacteraceae bacterium]
MPDPPTVDSLYRLLPSLEKVLQSQELQSILNGHSRTAAVTSARAALARIRAEISAGNADEARVRKKVRELTNTIASDIERDRKLSLRRVINATGVILHTNLGRAPLSRLALQHICEVASDYSNLELDLESGSRSRRDVHAESLILRLLAAKSGVPLDTTDQSYRALVVNNCAAATFLVLNSLADKCEVIVSRGELVEIGGGFRIPEILRKSGAILREVGTTNRTRLSDYESALSDRTALILRVHQSNFRIQGFAERPRLKDLISLARKNKVLFFEDQGTGLVTPLGNSAADEDSSFIRNFKGGPDVVAASGDKLLGGPQCGIILGQRDLAQMIIGNPLMRTFRVCKLTYAALEATIMDHLSGDLESNPVARMLALSSNTIRARCDALVAALKFEMLRADVVMSNSVIGGGTTPGKKLKSFAVALRHTSIHPDQLAALLRRSDPPVVSRVNRDRVLLDLRTVPPESDEVLGALLSLIDRQVGLKRTVEQSHAGTT